MDYFEIIISYCPIITQQSPIVNSKGKQATCGPSATLNSVLGNLNEL